MASYRPPQHLSRSEVSMVAKYDIFKKTNDSVVWVEAVEDIVAVKKRLISLGSPTEYRVGIQPSSGL